MNSLYFKIIIYLTIFIWLLPPFMQFKERYFYFFIILAISDLISIMAQIFFHINPSYIFIFISYLAYLSIMSKIILKKNWYLFLILFLIITSFLFSFNSLSTRYFIFVIVNILIFIKFLFTFISEIGLHKHIKYFLIVLLFYELTVIFKFINLITGFTDAYSYFIITSIFEFFVGVFFSVFKEDNPRIVIKLKPTY